MPSSDAIPISEIRANGGTAPVEFHPFANELPLLQGKEMDALKESIRARGLIDPITLYEGKILDGRNRYHACEETGVAAVFEEYTGDDPLGFVIAKNVDRRHLTTSQRAMIAARLANLAEGRPSNKTTSKDGVSQKEAATALKVSPASVTRAKRVLDEGTPEEIAAIDRGELAVNAAVRQLGKPKTRDKRRRIKVPEGETVESVCRLAMRPGEAMKEAAHNFGISDETLRKVRDLVRLLDMDLAPKDAALVREVMDEINETRRITPYKRLTPLVERVWGNKKHFKGLEKKRLEAFRRAVGVVIQAAASLPKIEIPYLGENEIREMEKELKAAEVKVRSFRNAIKEAHS